MVDKPLDLEEITAFLDKYKETHFVDPLFLTCRWLVDEAERLREECRSFQRVSIDLLQRAEAAEAQVQQLREALEEIRRLSAPAGEDYGHGDIFACAVNILADTAPGGK